MSEHGTPAIKSADDPAFKLPPSLAALWMPLFIGGAIAVLVGLLAGILLEGATFGMSVYLTAFIYCVTIALGSLFFVLIQHLSRAGWSAVVRRVAELMMMMIIPLGILFVPVLFTLICGDGTLYRWDKEGYGAEHHIPDEVWAQKTRWLHTG
ncbi:MAG: hypothetical protein MI861_12850, partial [Pirellulales bacterium]|nr:hypothetical protein [Pirellulales bacterium]